MCVAPQGRRSDDLCRPIGTKCRGVTPRIGVVLRGDQDEVPMASRRPGQGDRRAELVARRVRESAVRKPTRALPAKSSLPMEGKTHTLRSRTPGGTWISLKVTADG